MKDKIKNENYIMISGWMIKELNLKGSELLVYAIIYGFSQDGINKYEGSRQYLADWCNCTKQGIDRALKNLLKKKLITKEEKQKLEKIIIEQDEEQRKLFNHIVKDDCKQRIDKAIEYIKDNCILSDEWTDLGFCNFVPTGNIKYKQLSSKKVKDLLDILRGEE